MNYFSKQLSERANTKTSWMYEHEEYQYNENIKLGFKPIYNSTDIEYAFNSHGFRCDEFSDKADISIAHLGCSISEGLGLRYEDTWSYKLTDLLSKRANKRIPHWNLAFTGSGIDTQTRFLYELTTEVKVDYVFALFPSIVRREYCFDSDTIRLWNPSLLSNVSEINKLFVDEQYAYYETARSLMTLESLCKAQNIKLFVSTWASDKDEYKFFAESFPDIDFRPYNIPNTDVARDLVHYGPRYHRAFTNFMLGRVIKNFQ